MKLKNLLILTILWSITSCTRGGLPSNANMFQNKTFVHLFYETEEECMQAQPDPDFFINCHQQIDFKKDNEVEIMMTDMLWQGKYRVEGDILILSFEPNFEIPTGEVVFEILHPNLLLKSDDNSMWRKLNGKNIWK